MNTYLTEGAGGSHVGEKHSRQREQPMQSLQARASEGGIAVMKSERALEIREDFGCLRKVGHWRHVHSKDRISSA